MWRTSWLSREVIVLPALMGTVFLFGAMHLTGVNPVLVRLPGGVAVDGSIVAGVAGALLAFALFVCTAMIYACLKFLREWHSPLTVVNYTLMGIASGFTLAAALASQLRPDEAPFFAGWALTFTGLAAATRGASLVRNARLRPVSTLQTAIGVRHPTIRQISQGFTAGSFNTREFFHGRKPALVRSIKWLFLLFGFAIPAVLLAAFLASGAPVLAAAFVAQMAGLMAERWYFFAEANHPQNLYYQAVA
jgi:DMSO reductase anchor subunit